MKNLLDHIVDTNVAIVANGKSKDVSIERRIKSIDYLEDVFQNGRLIVDHGGLIEEEYRKHLSVGQPGVGNRFLQQFFQVRVDRLVREEITPVKGNHFQEMKFTGGLKKFDISDRKFAALSKKTKVAVSICVDSDWVDFAEELGQQGVKVTFICGDAPAKWFKNKRR
jgi:hypothetical protein